MSKEKVKRLKEKINRMKRQRKRMADYAYAWMYSDDYNPKPSSNQETMHQNVVRLSTQIECAQRMILRWCYGIDYAARVKGDELDFEVRWAT